MCGWLEVQLGAVGTAVPEHLGLGAACHILPVAYLWIQLTSFLPLLRLELAYKKTLTCLQISG